jgi:hypothetical protein
MSQVPPPGGAPPMGYASPGPQQSQGLAIGALVCGIISILSVCVWFLSIPLGIVAVILGIIGKGKAQRGEAGGQGLAKAGLILGAIGVVLSLILNIALIAGVSFLGSKAEQLQQEMEQKARELEQQQQVDQTETTPSPTTAP